LKNHKYLAYFNAAFRRHASEPGKEVISGGKKVKKAEKGHKNGQKSTFFSHPEGKVIC